MRRFPLLALLLLSLCGFSRPAEAAPILIANFCPQNNTCNGLQDAALIVSDKTSTAGDLNDYDVFAFFRGSATAPALLDLFSFSFNGVQTPGGYESLPTDLTGPAAYSFVFDNINNAASCTTNGGQAQEVCANIAGNGTALGTGSALFGFTVDFAGLGVQGDYFVTPNSGVNLRALFRDANGNFAGPILSPGGNYTSVCVDCVPTQQSFDAVPEPGSMILLSTGLLGAVRWARRRR